MNLNGLLDIELHNESLNFFNQSWEEMLIALGQHDEEMLESFVRKAMENVLMHEERFIAVPVRRGHEKKELRSHQKSRAMTDDIDVSTGRRISSMKIIAQSTGTRSSTKRCQGSQRMRS